ncbi:universal stress protein [Flavobacterium weaverense]|uniref:Nucleotide-binding universal stress UspA family protein n=2 Tax=Flavobacterium weaverense TaxID=271156 RepID=A0A3L9ZIF9_9FLAO|nr:universal stress protein [Flavobacterium weaverense]RMA72723.1 nucleotide-binding universal stress UspA family protein [Flavobacterium weaverense]
MKKILFPTDFSDTATNAFVHALEFAKKVNAEIILLHTFDLPPVNDQYFPQNYGQIYESIELSQFEMFKREIPKLRAIAEERNLDKIKMSHRLMVGDLLPNIKDAIKEDDIDFVIMGTAGVAGWEAFFVGTNTGSVITGIDIPMLCVPVKAEFKKIDIIGFTTRFRHKDKKALKMVLKIAKKTKAKVKCLYVRTSDSDVTKETIDRWEKEFAEDPIDFYVVENDDVQEVIVDFVMYKEVDMLAMLTYKRGFFERIFNPSLTKKIAINNEIPILAIPIE